MTRCFFENPGEQSFPLCHYLVGSESLEHIGRARGQTLTLTRVAHQEVHRPSQGFDVSVRHQNSIDAVANYLSWARSAIHCHRRQTARHCFQQGIRETFGVRRHNKELGVTKGSEWVADKTLELHPSGKPKAFDLLFEVGPQLSFAQD